MKREEKKQLIEENILKAIIVGLKEKDLDAMSADEIAGNSGVSKRTLYKRFASKKEMYLGVVKYCFKELAVRIAEKMDTVHSDDPYGILECIGYNYLQYCLEDRAKCKIITGFNENDYFSEYPEEVREIASYSNQFEISGYVERFYEFYGIKPKVSFNSLALYLWAHVQGLATLIMSKESWLKDYYGIEFEQLIKEHLELGKILLLGVKDEKEG